MVDRIARDVEQNQLIHRSALNKQNEGIHASRIQIRLYSSAPITQIEPKSHNFWS